jgi:hypothetical protein
MIEAQKPVEMWLIGVPNSDGGWMLEAIYYSEERAAAEAKEGEFIMRFDAGVGRLPADIDDITKAYYPRAETWEQSIIYEAKQTGVSIADVSEKRYLAEQELSKQAGTTV